MRNVLASVRLSAGLMCSLFALTSSGVNFSNTIADGGSETVAQGAKTAHAAGLGFKCEGAATITMTNAGGVTDGTLWHLVEAKAGTVVIDISGCEFETFSFCGGLVAQAPGKVILKATDALKEVRFGSTYEKTWLPYDVADFEIEVGGVRTTTVPIVFRDSFCLMRTPASDLTWSIAKRSTIVLGDANSSVNDFPAGSGDLLEKYYDKDGVLDIGPDGLDAVEFVALAPNALTAGKTLHVGGSAIARFYLCYYNDWWSIWGLKGGLGANQRANEKLRPKFDIVLDGESTVLQTGDANGLFLDGDVTGSGSVRLSNGGKDSSYVYFNGKYRVTGAFESLSSAQARAVFTNPEGYLGDAYSPNARVGLGSNHGISYELTGEGPYEAHLTRLASSYGQYGKTVFSTNCFVAVSGNTTLVVDDLDGVMKVTDGLERIEATDSVILRTGLYDYLAGTGHGPVSIDNLQGGLVQIRGATATTASFGDTLTDVEVVATNGARIVLCGADNDVRVTCAQGSRVAVSDQQWMQDMDADISLWLDATRANTSTNIYAMKDSKPFKVGDVVTYTLPEGNEIVASVDNWHDCRPGKTGEFYNRLYQNASDSFWLPAYASFYPHLMDDGPGGKAYMSLYNGANSSCRLNGYSWPGNKNPKFAVMVFGSQHGGGSSVLAVANEKFGRDNSSYENPIVTNTAYQSGWFWVDGEAVDPTETGFNGGWQILSCRIPEEAVRGLGYSRSPSGATADSGNQNYGEILFFNNELDDTARQRVERYLARKWGVASYKGPSVSSRVEAYGDGTIEIDMDTELAGGFTGTFEVDEQAKFLSRPQRTIPGEEAVIATDRTAWFDADYPDSLTQTKSAGTHPLNVGCWYDRAGVQGPGSYADGTPYAHNYNGDNRSPSRRELNGRTWLDFSHVYGLDGKSSSDNPDYNVVSGNMLRFGVTPNALAQAPVPVTNKTIFVAQDSSKGGGTPFLCAINSGGDLTARYVKNDVTGKSVAELAAMPIWTGLSATTFEGGETYLNGKAVDGTTQGFSGGPELLTAVTDGTKTFALGCFGSYLATDGTTRTDVGEILGEVIAYDAVLADRQREDIEAYLMWKWMSGIRKGYDPFGGISGAKITGAGTVVVDAQAGTLPTVADDFSGTVDCQLSELAFTLAEGSVVNPLTAKGGTIAFPAEVSISVSGDLADGIYTLVQAAKIESGTTFVLSGAFDEKLKLTLSATETAVTLVVKSRKGLLLLLR